MCTHQGSLRPGKPGLSISWSLRPHALWTPLWWVTWLSSIQTPPLYDTQAWMVSDWLRPTCRVDPLPEGQKAQGDMSLTGTSVQATQTAPPSILSPSLPTSAGVSGGSGHPRAPSCSLLPQSCLDLEGQRSGIESQRDLPVWGEGRRWGLGGPSWVLDEDRRTGRG